MGLLSFLKRSKNEPRRDTAAATGASDVVQEARTRVRRRLIGASVLLGLGIVGFPLLFETQPRPVSVDIPIEIPSKEAAAPLPLPPKRASAPAARANPPVITERPEDAGREVHPAASASASASASPPVVTEPPPTAKPVVAASAAEAPKAVAAASAAKPKPVVSAAAARADAERAKALLESRAAAKADPKPEPKTDPKPEPQPAADQPAKEDAGRFVVQVGAFADAAGARQARLKVEALGLKTYTQEVEVNGAKRIRVRVGPFASREAAAKVVGKVKAAGLPGALLTL